MWLWCILSCRPDDTPSKGADTAQPSGGDTAEEGGERSLPFTEAPSYSGGTCPTLVRGTNSGFLSGELDRRFIVELPEQPEGAGLLYAWHWLGGSASQIVSAMSLDELADEQGVIVIAPASSGSAYEWDFLGSPEGNIDLLFFDDLLACAHEQWGVDLDRVWSTGMSAGGLWTTYLSLFRAQHLAGSAPFSGGVNTAGYVSPADPIPMMLTWGGPRDTYSGFSFDEANMDFSAALLADGHFVVECVHDGGHTLPREAHDMIALFISAHSRAQTAEPWAPALPEGLPDWCSLP
jgi:predicted esterase